MNQLNTDERARMIGCLVEGNSMRATARMTGTARNTVAKLLEDVGAACLDYQDTNLVDLPCRVIECDEIWSFCYSKEKNVPEKFKGQDGFGDVWTWVAMDAETKLVPCWVVGERNAATAKDFMDGLASRLRHRVQLTTDGHKPYLKAVEDAFCGDIDYAMLVKMYGAADGKTKTERKYSPGEVNGIKKLKVVGAPDINRVSTSYVERQNLTMRMSMSMSMSMRGFTRLTNAFSKKVANHMHALSLHYMYYNFAGPHKALKGLTPAQASGAAKHRWSLHDIAGLLENS